MLWGFLDKILDVATRKQRKHNEWLTFMIAIIVDGDDVWMITESSHGLSFPSYPGTGCVVQAFCLDEGERYVSIKDSIVGEEDLFLAAFSEFLLDGIATVGERSGGFGLTVRWRRWR